MSIVSIEPILVDIDTAAEIVGLSKSTVQKLLREGDFPKPRRASKMRACYLVREIKEWAEKRPPADFLPPENTSAGGRNGAPNTNKDMD